MRQNQNVNGALPVSNAPLKLIATFYKDIKLAHSIFALPFALSAFVLLPPGSFTLTADLLLGIVLAMVFARSFGMGINRLIDGHIDGENVRTAGRAIPDGKLSRSASLLMCGINGALFVLSAFYLSPIAGWCSFGVLAIFTGYPLQKRWTWSAHLYLGVCLGLAPIGVCIAVAGLAPTSAVLLGIAVAFWTAGFDILYALQDIDFDKHHGLKSIPARFGPKKALWLSRLFFGVMIILLCTIGWLHSGGPWYWVGLVGIASILGYEHWLVRDAVVDGKSKHINAAFFNANAAVSIVFFACLILDWATR